MLLAAPERLKNMRDQSSSGVRNELSGSAWVESSAPSKKPHRLG
jgi:hypothetical protein